MTQPSAAHNRGTTLSAAPRRGHSPGAQINCACQLKWTLSMHPKPTPAKPERRAVNLSVNGKLIDEARRLKLNLSRVLEEALEAKLREQRALQWQEENREAIAFHNERIARDGLWHRGRTRWY